MTPNLTDDGLLDVQLVAYADGALSDEGCRFIEDLLEQRPELRDRLGQIRATQELLRRSLPAAPVTLDAARREKIHWAAAAKPPLRMSRWVWRLSAACLVLVVIGGLVLPSVTMTRGMGARRQHHNDVLETEAVPPVAVAAIPPPVAKYERRISNDAKDLDLPADQGRANGITIGHGPSLASEDENSILAAAAPMPSSASVMAPSPAVVSAPVPMGLVVPMENELLGRVKTEGLEESKGDPLRYLPHQKPGEERNARYGKSLSVNATKGKWGQWSAQDKSGEPDNLSRATLNLKPKSRAEAPAQPSKPAGQWLLPSPREYLTALADRGSQVRAAGRLDDVFTQQWNAPQAPPLRFLGDVRQGAAVTPSAGYTTGQNLLLAANRNGQQVIPLVGALDIQPARQALDPTATYGFTRADFQAMFGTAPMQAIADDAQQTFAIDASTASFTAAKAALDSGHLPDPAMIEPQHLYNAVPADYPAASGPEAFQLYAEAGVSPFAPQTTARIAPQGRTVLVALGVVSRAAEAGERLPLDVVIALDTSGSMGRPGGLDRARLGLAALLPQLDARDRVAVVGFGEVARVILPPVSGDQPARIQAAVATLRPDGATNAADGLALAYQVAGELAAPGRSCRVLLLTDGAALAGDAAALAESAVERWRGRGVSLLIVGCAREQYDAAALERLAQHGDGEHVVAASDTAAQELFTTRLMPARLNVLARDAKVQVTWNPARVTHARLIGFEKRRLTHEQFRDDRVDAGELTQDAKATALFEVLVNDQGSGPLGTAAVRYLDTRLNRVVELTRPLPISLVAPQNSQRLSLLACAAELGERMQGGWWRNVRGPVGDRLGEELDRIDHPFARVLERMYTRHQALERQDATP